MLSSIELVVFSLLLVLTVYGFFGPLYFRYRLIRLGLPEKRSDRPLGRLWDALTSFFFFRCSVKRERIFTGLVHMFLLYGSLTFDTVSIGHVLQGFKKSGNLFGHGWAGKIHSLWVDGFAVMVLLAVLYFLVRRFVIRPKSYVYPAWDSLIIYGLLASVTLTFLLYEGAELAVDPEAGLWAFAGKIVSGWLTPSSGAVKFWWWAHILNVFLFVLYVPRSKYLHMIAGPVNIFFKKSKPYHVIQPIDIEKAERVGVETLSDLKWKDLLDGFACVDCGRCEDYCPAAQTAKPLSPKNLIIHLRAELLKQGRRLLKRSQAPAALMNGTYTEGEIWACTTCGACMEVCPVKNEHMPKIIGLRQNQVLMQGKFPAELKNAFKGMGVNANPWDLGAGNRLQWAAGLDVARIQDKPDCEYLLYLGCAAAFDDRAQQVSRALVRFLNAHDISYAVLGEQETCCGETARRLGEEALGQMLIAANVELFRQLQVKKIITPCPHCFNTLKNEYPAFNGRFEVIHHSQLIQDLAQKGALRMKPDISGRVVIHDSCYLGRANGIYQPAREILKRIPGLHVSEAAYSREHGFCCGAGGGLFWVEEKEPRINRLRFTQLAKTAPSLIATSCPYCLKMLDDAAKETNPPQQVAVKDLVEIIVS